MNPERCTLDNLIEHEIGERPPAANEKRVTQPSRDVYGISLSGGGIRSSTFNLGLLQGLHRFRLIDELDYLSTVSGGGYVGSFWTAWRKRRTQPSNAPAFPEGTGSDGRPEPDPVRHLREFSNFLAPHLGVLSWDTGRILVNLASSLAPSLLSALSVITLAVLTWCLMAYGLFALDPVPSIAIYVGITALLLLVTEAVWRTRGEETDWAAYVEALSWGVISSGFVWWLLHTVLWDGGAGWYDADQRLPVIGDAQPVETWLYVLTPVGPWVAASFAMSIRRWLGSRWVDDHVRRVRRNSFDRVHARFIFAAVIWTVIAVLWWIGALLVGFAIRGDHPEVATGLVGSTGIAVWLFSRVHKRVSTEGKAPLGSGLVARLRPMLPQILAYLALVLMIVSTIAGIVAFDRSDFTYSPPLTMALASMLVIVVALLLFDPNEIGLHTFYRARIARAYLGASNTDPDAKRKTEERKDDDFRLSEIDDGRPFQERRPFHLICCAANDLASRELGSLHRGACSAVLSSKGLTVSEQCRLWSDELPAPTLSAAVTASAAAFNPLMGGISKRLGPAVTFLMAAFNLRLGLWLPGVSRTDPITWLERKLIGLPFFKEMFGLATADGRHVHLSDGGHFENMALYELIRRHCRFIIASDCGADPTVGFNDFGNVVRRVRADFGVDIQIDLSPLRPDDNGMSRQAMVAGDIHYPEGDTGILLLFKPSTTGNEPADVAQYQTRNDAFPHESTGDQFYDEAQWEAYRRLGEHVADAAFRHIIADLEPTDRKYVRQVFLRARREGQAVPDGFGGRLSHFADRIAEIDALLRQPECETLLREVYKEIDDLDRDRLLEIDLASVETYASSEPTDHDGDGSVGQSEQIEQSEPVEDGENVKQDGPVEGSEKVEQDRPLEEGEVLEHAESDARARASAERQRLPDPEDLAPSLHLIRRVLLLFQEAYTRENLEENHNHPLYLGMMNYFARWTSAPLFRLWWPLLKTMYPQPFTRFVERQYGVRSGARPGDSVNGSIGRLSTSVRGFAMRCWKQAHPEVLLDGQTVLPFLLRLEYRSYEYEVQAAQVVVSRVDVNLVWDADHFFVPPGLWGVGIGEHFLRQMQTRRIMESGSDPARLERLYVRITIDPAGGLAAKKSAANEIQLYRSAGFEPVATDEVPDQVKQRIRSFDEGGRRFASDGARTGSGRMEEWMTARCLAT